MLPRLPLALLLVLTACTAIMGPPLVLGVSGPQDVYQVNGKPAVQWREKDGSVQNAYTSSPSGTSTIMARFDVRQRLKSYEEVLNTEHFALLQPGMSMDEVVRIIGPPYYPWTTEFSARNELVWEWRYCDSWNEAARFNVIFDQSNKLLKSTLSLTEQQGFSRRAPPCGHVLIRLRVQPSQSSPATLPSGNSSSVKPN